MQDVSLAISCRYSAPVKPAAPAVDTAKARHDFLMSFRDGGKSSKTPTEVVSAPQLWEGGATPGAPQASKKAPKVKAISAQDVLKGLADQGRLGNRRKPPRQQQVGVGVRPVN